MGCKSPVRERCCPTGLHGWQDGASTRPKQLRDREVPWEGSLRSKLMSRRTERPYKVDGAGELARHSAARCSAPEINDPVVQQEFTSLLKGGRVVPELDQWLRRRVRRYYWKQWKRAQAAASTHPAGDSPGRSLPSHPQPSGLLVYG